MSIRVDHTVAPQISRDTNQKQKLFFPDLAEELVSHSTFDKASSSVLALVASGVESLSFGDVTDVRGIYLEVDGDCYVRINGSFDNIPLKLAPSATRAKLFLEVDLNAIVIQNLSAEDALTGAYAVWGDPTP